MKEQMNTMERSEKPLSDSLWWIWSLSAWNTECDDFNLLKNVRIASLRGNKTNHKAETGVTKLVSCERNTKLHPVICPNPVDPWSPKNIFLFCPKKFKLKAK